MSTSSVCSSTGGLIFIKIAGYCNDGGRTEDEDWSYQEARKIDPGVEKGVERPIRETQFWVGESLDVS